MLSRIGLISYIAAALRPRVRNNEGAVGAVHHVYNVARFGEVGRLLDGEEGRSARRSTVRIFPGRAHVVGGGERGWHLGKQGSKRNNRNNTRSPGASSDADCEEGCSDVPRDGMSTS